MKMKKINLKIKKKKSVRKKSIRNRFSVPVILVLIVLLILSSVHDYYNNITFLEQDIKSKADVLLELSVYSSSEPLWTYNQQILSINAEALFKDPEVGHVDIYDLDGKALVSKMKEDKAFAQKNMIYVQKEIKRENEVIGSIRIGISRYFRNKKIIDDLTMLVIGNLLLLVLMWIMLSLLSLKITKPIKSLIAAANLMANGDLRNPIEIDSNDEIGELASKFEEMRKSLQSTVVGSIEVAQTVSSTSEQLIASIEFIKTIILEMTHASDNIAESTEEQADNISHSVDILKNISNSIDNISVSSEDATKLSIKSLNLAEEGGNVADNAIEQMNEIESNIHQSTAVVKSLKASTDNIVLFVETIKSITSQLDMLSLNAAIEAARAGEHGKGFAVVAGEVKKLAEQSNESAEQISVIVSEINNKVVLSLETMENFVHVVRSDAKTIRDLGEMLKNIVDSSKEMVAIIKHIESDITIQATGSSDIVNKITKVSDLASQTAANAEETNAVMKEEEVSINETLNSVNELSAVSDKLVSSISRFKA